MSQTVLLCPGQGAQSIGMGTTWATASTAAKALCASAPVWRRAATAAMAPKTSRETGGAGLSQPCLRNDDEAAGDDDGDGGGEADNVL